MPQLKRFLKLYHDAQKFFKGCVCYLNRYTTSPTYILYQLNEKKMSFQSLITSPFTITIAIFKKGSCEQSVSFPQATLCLQNLERENRGKPAFKLCDVFQCPNESRFKNQHIDLGEIDDQIK